MVSGVQKREFIRRKAGAEGQPAVTMIKHVHVFMNPMHRVHAALDHDDIWLSFSTCLSSVKPMPLSATDHQILISSWPCDSWQGMCLYCLQTLSRQYRHKARKRLKLTRQMMTNSVQMQAI